MGAGEAGLVSQVDVHIHDVQREAEAEGDQGLQVHLEDGAGSGQVHGAQGQALGDGGGHLGQPRGHLVADMQAMFEDATLITNWFITLKIFANKFINFWSRKHFSTPKHTKI